MAYLTDSSTARRWEKTKIVVEFGPPTTIFTTAGATRALTFGKGIHYCLGAALAKLEAQVALRRFSRLRLVEGKKLSFQPTITLCGPAKLWAEAVSAA